MLFAALSNVFVCVCAFRPGGGAFLILFAQKRQLVLGVHVRLT